ncbi:hypothetical protein E2562_016726 [Oryza meyeriana var. granulata]|uniref:Uncharacterized protein n=1 Tax=Oryza meyeriana var. granulata TaxID=110450 RepID=A0A6G1BWQ9_9ORYZ|nr:hypothetical protein E2562_016726 [Oryza meyeriana var. granulata]
MCFFGVASVVYLRHVISGACVAMDTQKVHAVLDWPTPRMGPWALVDELLTFDGKIYILPDADILTDLVADAHPEDHALLQGGLQHATGACRGSG